MRYRTQGVVLSTSKYNDRYSITHIFVREFGKTAYILPKSKGRKSRINNALFAPFSVLNLHVEHLPLRQIQRLKDAERTSPMYSVHTDATKISIVFFLSELLSKVLSDVGENDLIFDYLKDSIGVLEHTEKGVANFHLTFLFRLMPFLGIQPDLKNDKRYRFFDLEQGEFTAIKPLYPHHLKNEEVDFLAQFKRINYRNMMLFRLSRSRRRHILDTLVRYYRLHLYDFPSLKSLDTLYELF